MMSGFLGTGVLALWLDVDSSLEQETDYWYLNEHLPDRIHIGGYLRARRYVNPSDSPKYLTLFEAHTPESLASEGYLSLVKNISKQSQIIRAGFSNVFRNTFTVFWSKGSGIGRRIWSLRLSHPQSMSQFNMEMMTKVLGQIATDRGIVGVHFLIANPQIRQKMDHVRAVGTNDQLVDYVLFIEYTMSRDIEDDNQTNIILERLKNMGWIIANSAHYDLLFELSH
jgi:hypothetical protein